MPPAAFGCREPWESAINAWFIVHGLSFSRNWQEPRARTVLVAAAPAGHFGREIARRKPAGSLGMPMRTLVLPLVTGALMRIIGSVAYGFGLDWFRGELSGHNFSDAGVGT